MRKRMKRLSAIALAVVLASSVFVLPDTFAAVGVETDRTDCSLVINFAAQEGTESVFEDVTNAETQVNLYKAAAIDVSGNYTAVDPFKDVKVFAGTDKETTFAKWLDEKLDSTTSAGDWADVAKAIDSVIATAEETESTSDNITVTKTVAKEKAKTSVNAENLETGLYLVDVQRILTEEHRYEFTPYLISVPNNNYSDTVAGSADDWVYQNITVGLKPQQFNRYGYLKIEKVLDTINGMSDGAVFVFEVTAAKDGETVFNDVVAIDYLTGTDRANWVKVGPIEAGAEVTVEEVYTGANYEKVPDTASSAMIIEADPVMDEAAEDTWDAVVTERLAAKDVDCDVSVTFTNKSGDKPFSGTGVVNTFKADDDRWDASQDYQGQELPTSTGQ